MRDQRISRRHVLGLLGSAGALVALPGCGSSIGGDSGSGGESDGGSGSGAVKVGLVIPQSGVYAPLGVDMRRGWDLWLARHDGRLGEFQVTTVPGDEGEGPQTGVPAVQKLLQNDQCDVLVGVVNSSTALGVRDLVTESKKVLVVANAGAGDVTAAASSPYIWRTSFTNAQVAAAMGRHLAGAGSTEGVYVIAPDYAAGTEAIEGFTAAFTAAGGTVVDSATPPFGTTQDYQPFLSGIRAAGAQATFCFFAGAEAVAFVQQYSQFGLAESIPLYGSGFLTEGGVLAAQGDAALGVQTTLHYTSELDNPANAEFVQAYQDEYGETPTVYSVQAWDAAEVLHRALADVGGLDGDTVSDGLSSIGEIDNSPRGPWGFDGQSPRQHFYLREVRKDADQLVNTVVADLGELSQND